MPIASHSDPLSLPSLNAAEEKTGSGWAPDIEPQACGGCQPGSCPQLVYDLRGTERDSDGCYADAAAFSTRLLAEIEAQAGPILDGYIVHVNDVLRERSRSRGEYAIELLTLGMMLKFYAAAASGTPRWVVQLARELLSLRRRSEAMKGLADFLRARLFRTFSVHKLWAAPTETPRFECLPDLIEWLNASGEFEQESMRLVNWKSYLATLPRNEIDMRMQTAMDLFEWFTREASSALSEYTHGVDTFLATTYADRGVREDQIFCGKRSVEYHLGMVAAEIMNRGLREEFQRTSRKVVLLPTCMRGVRADECLAHSDDVDIDCSACDQDCTVNRITRRMEKMGVEVYLVPHTTGFSRWLDRWQNQSEVGVVAVACMANILSGGFEMRARAIASQCVPLDFPGCQKHWSGVRITTGVNEERLARLVGGSPDPKASEREEEPPLLRKLR